MAGSEDDRRRAERHTVWIGAEIETEGGPVRSAITEDASATGFLLLTRAKLEPGQAVRLRIYLGGPEGEPRGATGRVVRRVALDPDESTLWKAKVGVVLDEPMPELANELAAVSARQAELYGIKR